MAARGAKKPPKVGSGSLPASDEIYQFSPFGCLSRRRFDSFGTQSGCHGNRFRKPRQQNDLKASKPTPHRRLPSSVEDGVLTAPNTR